MNPKGRRLHVLLAVTLLGALAVRAPSQEAPAAVADAEARGLAIARDADQRASGFGDQQAVMIMTLLRSGEELARRVLRSSRLELEGDGDRSLVVFDEPRDLRGTALLSWSHAEREDDQWLYLPAIRRVKRLSAGNRSGSFVGTEFSYEDLAPTEVEDFTYRLLREEACPQDDSRRCFVLERKPRFTSAYSRQQVWLDTEHLRPLRVDAYDRGDELAKTLAFSDYRLYLEHLWLPHRAEMTQHKTGRSTVLEVSEYELGTGLDERDFDPDRLQDVR